MFNRLNLVLIIFLTTVLVPIYVQGVTDGNGNNSKVVPVQPIREEIPFDSNHEIPWYTRTPQERKGDELIANLGDLSKLKELIHLVDLNAGPWYKMGFTVFGQALDKENRHNLEAIEYLLQHGADVNAISSYYKSFGDRTPLHQVLDENNNSNSNDRESYLKLIRLLLGYGALVDDKILKLAKKNKYSKKIIPILHMYRKLVANASINPTAELLTLAIGYNMPYVVQLIVDAKPDLVTLADVNLARLNSPAAVPILSKVLNIIKFEELATKKDMPVELREHIKRFCCT